MIKNFPRARVCVIDVYSSFEKGLTQARNFALKHNILLSSTDGKKLISNFCFTAVNNTYKNTPSAFPKVLCISDKISNSRINYFVKNHFHKMLEKSKLPYCGCFDLTSPDLETAAENILKR